MAEAGLEPVPADTLRTNAPGEPFATRPWAEAFALDNGLACYLTSPKMLGHAKFIAKEIFVGKCYSRPGFELRHDDTVVDIGGNVGLFVLWAAPQVPDGRIVTIEPQSGAISCLKLNIELNKLSRVTLIEAAVGAGEGELELVTYPGYEGLTRAAGQANRFTWLYNLFGVKPVRSFAPLLPLSKIIADHDLTRIDFLKIDCEGGEYEIMRGLTPSEWHIIDRIVMEFHEFNDQESHAELVWLLRSNGFDVSVEQDWLHRRLVKTGVIKARRRAAV